LVVGLVAIVVVVAVALVAWMVVLPVYRSNQGTSGPVVMTGLPRAADEAGEEENLGSRIPVIREQPKGWSAPVKLTVSDDIYFTDVVDTGIGDIVIVESRGNVQAIELGTQRILWTVVGYYYRDTIDNRIGLVGRSQAEEVEYLFIDLRTGALTPINEIPSGEIIEHIWNGVIVTVSGNHYCARQIDDISNCQWRARMLDNDFHTANIGSFLVVFGDGRWINTMDGVFDLELGGRASFGSDVFVADQDDDEPNYEKDVMYAGPSGGVVRVTVKNDDSLVIQPWDTDQNRSKAKAVTLRGYIAADSLTAGYLFTDDSTEKQEYVLRAYSWQTGQQLWKISPTLKSGMPCHWFFQDISHLHMEVQVRKPLNPNSPRNVIFVNETGKILWIGDEYIAVQNSEEVVYAVDRGLQWWFDDDHEGMPFHAFDSTAGNFIKLWSIDAPGRGIAYHLLAYHVIALSYATGELWVLQR